MKESITKFDLEAAFKALDEIDMPKAERGIKANRPALTEIFSRKSKFDALFEEYYDIGSSEGLEDAQGAREAEIAKAKLARIEKIVDLDADSPEDLLTSYVGKYIMQCPQCMMLFYKNQEDIEKSEEDPNTVNVSEVCQHCGNDSGYTLIGKVGEASAEDQEDVSTEAELDALGAELTDEETAEASEEPASEDDTAEEAEGEDFNLDDELAELDLEIEDDETEEKKEEAFTPNADSSYLVEQLTEDSDLEVSAEEFEELINSPEFKKPVSNSAVRAMLNAESNDNDEDIKESVRVNNETLRYAVINPDGTYAGVPCTSYEEARELAAGREGRIIVELIELKKNSLTESQETDQLEEGGLGLLGKTIGKKVVQTGKNIKNAVSKAIDKFADNTMTREEKADWLLANTPQDPNEAKLDDKGELISAYRKYKTFVVLGFTNKFNNGRSITKAPDLSVINITDLVIGIDKPITKKTYKEADIWAKGWSLKAENGPALIYLAKDANDPEAVLLCQYFDGKITQDALEFQFKTAKESIATIKQAAEATNQNQATESLNNMMSSVEELTESSLESFISDSLVESYGNVAGFRLKDCSYLNNRFNVDGIIYFTSGNTRKTTYTFTEAIINDNVVELQGLNEKLGLDKTFKITGSIDNNTKTFITESFKCTKG